MTTRGRQAVIEYGQLGHAALYVLLLLPVVLSLTSLAVDVSAWNALRDKLQQEADRLALQAVNVMPNAELANSFVLSAAADLPGTDVHVETFLPNGSGSSIGVKIRAAYRPTFDLFVGSFVDKAFTIERSSTAQVVPTDYVLILADGSSLRPPLQPQTGVPGAFDFTAWGSALDWPASGYFSCVQPAHHAEPNDLNWKWWQDWNRADFRRWATQSCFNPVLSPLKLTGIGVSESLLRLRSNRVAVVFTPGESTDRGYRVARHIHGEADEPNSFRSNIGGFPQLEPTSAQAHWGGYLELDQLLGDEICMLIADPGTSFTDRYELTAPEQTNSSCPDALSSPLCGTRHYVTGHFSNCYLSDSLSVREAIYWDAAKLPLPGFSAKPDIPHALTAAWNELTNSGSLPNPSQNEVSVRGNLAFSALRKVLLVTDSLSAPAAGEPSIEKLIELFRSAHIELVVVPFFHEGLTAAARGELELHIRELQAIENAQPPSDRTLRILTATDPENLQTEIGPKLVTLGRQLAIRS